MTSWLLTLLGGSGRQALEGGMELRVVPAMEVLQARREAMEKSGDDAQALGMWMNACLLARAVYQDGKRVFADGQALLRAVTAKRLSDWAQRYAALCEAEEPACSAENAERMKTALAQTPQERLRWRILREFGVLPWEARARALRERDYLYCAAQMMLDEEEKLAGMCPACRAEAESAHCTVCGAALAEENAGFDEKRFEELRNARVCEEAASDAAGAGGAV